jgi:hypothetical protein
VSYFEEWKYPRNLEGKKKKKKSRLTNALHFERRFENESAQVSKVQIKTTV